MTSDQALTALLMVGSLILLLWPRLRARLGLGGGMPAAAVQARLERGDPTILLDVRSGAEVATGTLPGAINIPLPELASRIPELLERVTAAPETGVIIICQSGMRAQRAVPVLAGAGVQKLAVLKGGVTAWRGAGLPMV